MVKNLRQPLSPLAQHFVAHGLLEAAQAQELVNQAQTEDQSFILYLEEKKWVDPKALIESAAEFFSLPFYNLEAHQTQHMPTEFLSLEIVKKGFAIPLSKKNQILFLGVADPELINISEIAFSTGVRVKLILVEADKLRNLVSDIKEMLAAGGVMEAINTTAFADFGLSELEAPVENIFEASADDKPIVQYINQLIAEAVKLKASDIHFEPYDKYYRIRFRIDGILREVSRSAVRAIASIVARLKVLASLDIAEHRIPQDGRFKITLPPDKSIDFRISVCPTLYGEKIVLRILDPTAMPLDLNLLGMESHQTELYLNSIHAPQGIILVTGPTGSGKTVSLYTALNLLNSVQKNICTVEDPIEIYLTGINQVHMNTKTGLTFARALRAFLRQDPDIIMVGEIRDAETADIALKAAETGHLVMSTLHTNSAPATIARLVNIGMNPYNIANSVILIVAQRLLRKLCDSCKKEISLSKEILLRQGFSEEEIPTLRLFGPNQCPRCNSGYRGRIGIYEVMPITVALAKIISDGGDMLKIAAEARAEGVLNLREAGLIKVKAGITSLEELNSVVVVSG
ncbi:MAG: hypothetical protein ACD_29C00025G0003 [uncultured bacterium]|nr:MAG: hypothetical protein ACD_29C00025G0003 [uncultured bacterium]